MKNNEIANIALKLIKKADSRDPFAIAKELGIEVIHSAGMGNLKGMYTILKRNRFIIVNDELNERLKAIVCAHEIGHDQLHRHLAQKSPLQEFALYEMQCTPEYEANILAAEILLDTKQLLDYIHSYNYSADQIACAMNADVNLVALKIAYLREQGYDLRAIEHRSDFLR